jgi:predicted Zn-dependent protease with MMP-like domain
MIIANVHAAFGKSVNFTDLSPSLPQFLTLVRRAFDRLPPDLRERCATVRVEVADYPPPHALEPWEGPLDVVGLFTPLYPGNTVHLFRRPLLDLAAKHSELPLDLIIEVILAHELGHAMGLGDAEMACIESEEL